ncbi:hypothetical protein LOZ12_005230 [Ophidiomyces ophidiicola]|nr:hypothetical protein LOZ47_004953 [Ophidiomyces ophidiicola]KAI2043693.1 hypothetical protein LOZ44_005336 [Ophidiomyces ophidiicola]KAI2048019.1 hypothetical protein LOZ43_005497 [Ophidiomyces ophidiicola]KAI2062782.1 hypothetical protein LOZ40_005735 [Ophidiomyces ophidiicola]KAI2074656.1 hypothetical protein LOZ37_003704 [Ophidiomyces ophidiicola]
MNEIPGTELVMPCWNSLDCTLKDLDSMAMIDRLKFIQYMTRRKLSHLGSENQFNAIEAVIGFFVTRGLGTQGTVMSLVNAVGLEAIQRGAAISLGYSNSTAGNPAASKWATFLDQRKTGKLVDCDMHDRAWSIAEQTAVNYGMQLASSRPDLKPLTQWEQRWHQFTNVFRTIMQHRQTLLWLIKMIFSTDPSVPIVFEAFLNWVTDITEISSIGLLSEVAWQLSLLELSWKGGDPAGDVAVMLQMIFEFWKAFQVNEGLL